jgi:hypothetical protein
MLSTSVRALGRRQIAVMAAGLMAFGGFAVYQTQSSASAHETKVSLGMTCPVEALKTSFAVNVDYVLTHTPTVGPIAGSKFTLHVASTTGGLPADFNDVPVSGVGLKIPVPAGVTPAGGVTLTGGSFDKTAESVAGGTLAITLTAHPGTTAGNLVMPTLSIPMGIPTDAEGETLTIEGPSELSIVAGLAVTCTANAGNTPLLAVKVLPVGTDPGDEAELPTAPTTDDEDDDDTGSAPTPVKVSPKFTG